jgi:hypothetical protein
VSPSSLSSAPRGGGSAGAARSSSSSDLTGVGSSSSGDRRPIPQRQKRAREDERPRTRGGRPVDVERPGVSRYAIAGPAALVTERGPSCVNSAPV